MRLHPPAFAALLGFVVGGGAACGRSDPPPPPAPSARAAAALDDIDPTDLVEGELKVQGLPLPRGATLRADNPWVTIVEAPYSMERVANYLRKRLDAQTVETGPQRTVFVRARHTGQGAQGPLVTVAVKRKGISTEISVHKEREVVKPAPRYVGSSFVAEEGPAEDAMEGMGPLPGEEAPPSPP